MKHVLVCGTSTRAIAQSAVSAGYRVTAIDAFADRDQHPLVQALSGPRDLSVPATATGLSRAASGVTRDAAVYLSPFENHPRAVATLAAGGTVWGNPPDTLRRVRNPLTLAATLRRHGFQTARVFSNAANASNDPNGSNDPNDPNEFLVKPLHSGGGRRIRIWRGERVRRTSYLQERVEGVSGSLIFVAAGGRSVPIAFSRQLVGEPSFGARGFRYCGSILSSFDDPQFFNGRAVFDAASALARCVASEFQLVGLNGIDFIAGNNTPYVLEVNPRWCASAEVAEQAFQTSVFSAHADACSSGALPSFDCAASLARTKAFGRAIVYAREGGCVGETADWLADPSVRDVPCVGTRFRAGDPVCSILASAADSAACYRQLVQRAAHLYEELDRISVCETSP